MARIYLNRPPESLLRFGQFPLNPVNLGQIVQGIGIARLQLERVGEGIDSLSRFLLFEIDHAGQVVRFS